MPTNPYFSKPLSNGFAMNPSTGEIMSPSGQVYSSAQQLMQSSQQAEAQPSQGQSSQGNSSTQTGVNTVSMGKDLYDGYNYLSGAGATGSGASAASGAGSYSLTNTLAPAYGYSASGGTGLATGGAAATGAGVAEAAGGYSLGTGALSYGGALGGTAAAGSGGAAAGAGSYSLSGALGSSAFGGAATTGGTAGAGAVGGVGGTTGVGGTAGVGGSTLGTMGAVAWPLAIAATAYMSANQYENARKQSGGASSQADWYNFTHPGGSPKITEHLSRQLSKIPGSPSWIANALFGASKQKQEAGARKVNRRALQNIGLMNPDSRSRYNLADGTQFDIRDYKASTGNDAYNIDFNNPVNADGIGFLNAITGAAVGDKSRKGSDVSNGKTKSDLTGELYNAANSNGQLDQNIRAMGDKVGGRNVIYQAVLDRWKGGDINADMRDNYLAAIDKQYGIANPNNNRWDANLTGKEADRNQREKANAEKKRQEAAAKNPKPVTQSIYSNPRFK